MSTPELEVTNQQAENPAAEVVRPAPPNLKKLLLDTLLCVAIPVIILIMLSGKDDLGPRNALILALAFPLVSGLLDFVKEKKVSLIPAIGFISVLLTGGIGVLELPKEYIAIKEALVPLGFGCAVLFSIYAKRPIVRTMLYNDMLMETEKVAARVNEQNKVAEFNSIFIKSTWILVTSFLLSSVLNYALAKFIIVSETGTEAFNKEFGTLTAISYPVIAIPSMAVTLYAAYYAVTKIAQLTGFELDEIFRGE